MQRKLEVINHEEVKFEHESSRIYSIPAPRNFAFPSATKPQYLLKRATDLTLRAGSISDNRLRRPGKLSDMRFFLCSAMHPLPAVALYHTIYICCMAYRTLDLRYTLLYILICVLHHTKLQTLFIASSYHFNLCMLTTYCN